MISVDVSLCNTVSDDIEQSPRGRLPLRQSPLVNSELGCRLMRRRCRYHLYSDKVRMAREHDLTTETATLQSHNLRRGAVLCEIQAGKLISTDGNPDVWPRSKTGRARWK